MGCKCPCEFAQTLKIRTLFWLIFQIMHFSTVVAVKLQKALKKTVIFRSGFANSMPACELKLKGVSVK